MLHLTKPVFPEKRTTFKRPEDEDHARSEVQLDADFHFLSDKLLPQKS